MNRSVRWVPVQGLGAEHVHIRTLPDGGHLAESVVVGTRSGEDFGLSYRIVLDDAWRVRRADLRRVGEGPCIVLRADGQGHWHDARGVALAALDGCIDIDIAATPLTNTLPIRRLGLRQDESQLIRVVYVPVPGLEPIAVDQRYTCLRPDRVYRYEGLSRGFTEDLTVDVDGIVVDYPPMFRRVEG
jgi:hypothetical protein